MLPPPRFTTVSLRSMLQRWLFALLAIAAVSEMTMRLGARLTGRQAWCGGGVAASHMPSIRMCYFCFGSVSDLGWTFTYNADRLRIHDVLGEEFPNVTLASTAIQNFFQETEKRRLVREYINGGCNVILTNNDQLLGGRAENDYFAATFPDVHFILLGENWLDDHTYPNRVYVANDYTGGFYAAGAAAGTQASRCIAYLSAWDTEVDPTSGFAGFLLGVRSVNATMPVHVISQDSWYDPDGDRVLTNLFLDAAQCDVIARYSDPYTVDVAVNAWWSSTVNGRRVVAHTNDDDDHGGDSNHHRNDNRPPDPSAAAQTAFSIGCHSNLQQYVGDTVLTSIYVDWSVVLLPALRSLIVNGTLNQDRLYFPGLAEGAITLAPASPLASRAVDRALHDSAEFVKAHGNVVCGPIRLRNGGYLRYEPGANCKVPHSNIADFVTDAFVIQHPTFVAASACAAGHAYRYSFESGTLALVCTACRPGTYAAVAGSPLCTACASDEWSPAASRSCTKRTLLSGGALAAVVIGSIVFVVCAAAVVHWQRSVVSRNALAPRQGPLCLLFTDIEGCAAVRKLQPDVMQRVAQRHDEVVRAVLANNDAYEVGKQGYGFVIATQCVVDAMIVALEIQRAMMAAVWPPVPFLWPNSDVWNGPRVSIGLHHCRDGSDDTIVSYNTLEQRYTYGGRDPMAAARLGALAQGGQIVITQDTLDAMMLEPHYELLLAHDMCVRLWSTDCPLYATSSPASLVGRRHGGGNRNDTALSSALRPDDPLSFAPTDLSLPASEALPFRNAAGGGGTVADAGNNHIGGGGGGIEEETAMLYAVTPAELATRTFQPCPIGYAPMDPDGRSALHGGLSTHDDPTNTADPSYGRGGPLGFGTAGWPLGDELQSAVSSGRASTTAATNVLVRLLAWVGASQRKPLVHMLLHCLSRNAAAGSGDDGGGAADNEPNRFRNPKRLAAAVAAEIVLEKQQNPLLAMYQREGGITRRVVGGGAH